MSKPDFYEILGVERTATPSQIRAAHRTNARKYHPDTADDGRGDPHRFAQVQEAYEILSVADFRRRYDNKQAAERGETELPGKRRPPKSPCAACKKQVYASQLTLYLGRYMCKACFDRKQRRDSNRPKLTSFGELCWRLRLVGVWMQVHFAIVAIVIGGLGAVGARMAWMRSQSHHGASAANDEVADSDYADPVTGMNHTNARNAAPVASVDTADHSDRATGK